MAPASPHFDRVVLFHRKRAGLTRVQLARLAGVGKTAIFDIEHGKRTVQLDTLLAVLAALNVNLTWSSPLRDQYPEADDDAEG